MKLERMLTIIVKKKKNFRIESVNTVNIIIFEILTNTRMELFKFLQTILV